MKRVLCTFATVIALTFCIACGSQPSTPANAATGSVATPTVQPTTAPTEQVQVAAADTSLDFQPQVDVSKIHSWSDYDKAKIEAWKRYDGRKSKAWKEYEATKGKAWTDYSEFEKAELLKVRNSNREAYLDYLDADKLNDYERRSKLETSVPELAKYKRLTAEKYKTYKQVDDNAYKRHQTIDRNAYKVYQVEEKMAYEAYKAIKQ